MEDVKAELKPGDLFAGKYRIERVLGEGGFGVVLAARHVHTQDRVALKFLQPDKRASAEVQARFVNEARAAVQIKSEHVARVTDVDMLPTGGTYMVMEYLDGSDLGAILERTGPLQLSVAVDYLLQACEALAEAHSLGIVHRDLKPPNLFLTRRRDGSELVKVLDFGISKLSPQEGEARLTRTRGAMGSPMYMSPEQMTAPKSVDARSDIWSLGVVLFELLTGRWPFEAATVQALAVEIVTGTPFPLATFRPDLPEGVARIIDGCLRKKPDDRFASVEGLAQALAAFGSESARRSSERISRVLGGTPGESRPSLPQISMTVAMPRPAPVVVPAVSTPEPALSPPTMATTNAPWSHGVGVGPVGVSSLPASVDDDVLTRALPASAMTAAPSPSPALGPAPGKTTGVSKLGLTATAALVVIAAGVVITVATGPARKAADVATPVASVVAPAASASPTAAPSASAGPGTPEITPVTAGPAATATSDRKLPPLRRSADIKAVPAVPDTPAKPPPVTTPPKTPTPAGPVDHGGR